MLQKLALRLFEAMATFSSTAAQRILSVL